MPNPNPKLENLTRAGMGRPAKDGVRREFYLDREIDARITALMAQQDWSRTYTLEQLLRHALGLPGDYSEDIELIVRGAPIE